ncbi:MAG: FGGY-family carbohydrate kinase [Amaricoccus sp.]
MSTCVVCDLGAGSGRVMLARYADGRLDLDEIHRFDGYAVERPDGPRWDVPRILDGVLAGLRRAQAAAGRIDAIGVDSWGLDYALLDADGAPATEPFHYRHPRSRRGFDACPVPAEAAFARTGCQILPVNTIYQLADEAVRAPARHAGAAHLLMFADLVCHHLTGEVRAERTLARTSGLLTEAGAWSAELCDAIGLDRRLLPPLVEPGQVYGHLRPDLGLGPVPVIAVAAHDTASAVAALALGEESGFVILGSWSLVGAETGKVDRRPAVRDAGFGNEGGIARPFLVRSLNGLHLVRKLRDSLRRRGTDLAFPEIARLAAGASAGPAIDPADPAFFDPPDMVEALAARCGRAVADDPGAAARAVYAGLAAEVAAAITALERLRGRALAELRVCGGGAQDALLCDLIAATTGKPLVVGPIEATAWGNAVVQLLGLGALPSLDAGRRLVERSARLRRVAPEAADARR